MELNVHLHSRLSVPLVGERPPPFGGEGWGGQIDRRCPVAAGMGFWVVILAESDSGCLSQDCHRHERAVLLSALDNRRVAAGTVAAVRTRGHSRNVEILSEDYEMKCASIEMTCQIFPVKKTSVKN